MRNKKFFNRVAVIFSSLTLGIIFMFLPSCSSSNNEESTARDEKTATLTQEVKVVDMLEAVGSFSRSSVSVTYLLLENGEVVVYTKKYTDLPYTKEEAKQIMAYRRGEEVTVTIPVK